LKKLAILLVVGVGIVAGGLAIADSFQPRTYVAWVDTTTVTTAYTATAWDSITNVIVDRIDTAYVLARASGIVYLAPHDRLYIGFDDDTTAGAITVPEDTGIFQFPPETIDPGWLPFVYTQKIDLADGADADTIFLLMSLGSDGASARINNIIVDAMCVDSAT